MDFIYLFRVLLKRKWIIIGAAVLASLVAYFFTRNEPKKFLSSAQVSTGFTVSDEVRLSENFNVYEAETKFNNVIVTMTSPAVTSLLSYMLMLHDLSDPQPFHKMTPEMAGSDLMKGFNKEEAKKVLRQRLETMHLLTSYNPEEKKLLELLQAYGYDNKTLSQSLNIYRVQRTDYIQIDYASHNPLLSAFVVNSLYQQFLRYYKSVRTDRSQQSIDTLYALVEKKRVVLEAKNKEVGGGALVDADLQSEGALNQIGALQDALTQEKSKNTELTYSLRKVNARLNALREPARDNGGTNDELLILRSEMQEAYRAYLNSGSNDAALLSKYNGLKARYQRELLNTRDNNVGSSPSASRVDLLSQKNDIELDIQGSNANIRDLTGRINALRGSVTGVASRGRAAESQMKELDLATKEYLDAKQKYNEAMDMNSASVSNFRQVVQGQPAIEPEPSKRKMIVGLAGAAALFTTMFIIIFLSYLDSSIKTPIIFSKTVNLKLISMVNFMDMKNKSIADIVANREVTDDPNDKTRNNKFRESLRKLRYEIESSGKKVFLFTSTKKGQGKTTLIQALAYSMSMSKKKILIIDTNFCNNDLTVQLNANPVLEKIIPNQTNNAKLLDQIKTLSKDVGAGSVFAIGSEGGDYTPSEILPREHLLKHLQSLTSEFDYIFLEGPPLNDFSDSKELAQYVDGVIAVFSANHIIKQIDKQSIGFFKELNGKFTGSILNMVDLKNVNVA